MCYQYRISHKRKELRKNRLDIRRIHHHLICNTGQLCNLKRNRNLRIHKRAELLGNLALFHFYRSDLYDLVLDRAESGRFQVKYHISSFQRLSFFIHSHIRKIIYQITFHPIDHLERIIFIQILHIMIGIRKCLYHTMVGNRKCFVSPVMRTF